MADWIKEDSARHTGDIPEETKTLKKISPECLAFQNHLNVLGQLTSQGHFDESSHISQK